MSGFNDPYSGFFGEPGAWNWPVMIWCGFAGLIGLVMLAIFLGFDSNGFLHNLEQRFGIRNPNTLPEDE